MGYNWQYEKMKKLLISATVLIGLIAGAMVLSAFTTSKQAEKNKGLQTEVKDCDPWKLFRENVAYCDGDQDVCAGTNGYIWVNTETYQAAISIGCSTCGCTRYDLTQSDKKEGYNMRFWKNNKWWYVYINIPRSAYRQ